MSGGLFGNLFDFNNDGNIDIFERIVELETLKATMDDGYDEDDEDDEDDE